MVADFPSAAFRRGPFTVDLDGTSYVFPAMNAAQWLDLLVRRDWPLAVVQQMPEESYDHFTGQPEVNARYLERLACAALATAGGRTWWETFRLAHIVTSNPNVLGSVLMRGTDPERLTLAAFLSCVRVMIMQGLEEIQRTQLDMELTMPPPEALEAEGPQEMSMEDLVAQMRGIPGVSVG